VTSEQEHDDLSMRPARAQDAHTLAELFLAAREAAYPAMPRPVHPPEVVHRWFTELLGSARETWVAERDGAVVGYLVLDPDWLDSLYVQPELTGQRIGAALLDLAKALRPEGFGLWVFESNEPARRFYRRHGLVEVRRTDGRGNEEQAPDIEMVWLGLDPLAALRARIDGVDDDLAELLDRRARLTALVQQHKAVPGHAGRDGAREAEIAERMAARAPRLGTARVGRIMHAVITESLDAADEQEC
jgi:chorismate mutase/GNAT superfamily N-acetyltransferase